MKNSGIFKKIVILVLVLLVPGFLYYLLTSQGKNRYKPLRIFGPKIVAHTSHRVKGKDIPDTIFHTLPAFKLTDQNGKQRTLNAFDDKIFVVNFFYTHCPTVCEEMNRNLAALDSIYAKNKMVYFVSITVDPMRDSVAVLRKYANRFSQTSKRILLTGDTATIYNLSRKGFLENALRMANGDFIYSNRLILVDEKKRIRGYYNGAQTAEVGRLDDEIKVLIQEELLQRDKPLY